MKSSIYQRFYYWFSTLILSVFILTYQNCSDVGFKRVGGFEDASGIACLPPDFSVNMSPSTAELNIPVNFSVNPPAANVTYSWELNNNVVGIGPEIEQTFTSTGNYTMNVKAEQVGCENVRTKTLSFSIMGETCNLQELVLSGDSTGMVDENLNYLVAHNCPGLTFAWNAGDGSTISNTNNTMTHAWQSAGVYVVSTVASVLEITPSQHHRLAMPVSIQDNCPALNQLFVTAPDVARVNEVVPFTLVIPGCLNVTSIDWDFGDSSTGSGLNVNHTYNTPGVKNVSVVVTTASGDTITLPHRITILDTNVPVCDANTLLTLTGPTVGYVGESLRYGVYVPDCMTVTQYIWDYNDGSTGSGNPVTHAFMNAGEYIVSVKVITTNHGHIYLNRRVVILSPTCSNGATNPPACNQCSPPQIFNGTSCVAPCTNGANNPPACNTCSAPLIFYGGACVNPCSNGAINPTLCDQCPTGQVMVNGQCVKECSNGANNPPVCNTCPSPLVLVNGSCIAPCTNGAINPPSCNTCPAGQVMVNGQCTAQCTNGATNPPTCNQCPVNQVLVNNQCVNVCTNGATNPPTCTTCPTGSSLVNGVCTAIVYEWRIGNWGHCLTNVCGTVGTQSRPVQCINRNDGTVVADALCPQPKPATTQACTDPSCAPFSWEVGKWSACLSAQCGAGGVKTRTVVCKAATGQVVADNLCPQPKPETSASCIVPCIDPLACHIGKPQGLFAYPTSCQQRPDFLTSSSIGFQLSGTQKSTFTFTANNSSAGTPSEKFLYIEISTFHHPDSFVITYDTTTEQNKMLFSVCHVATWNQSWKPSDMYSRPYSSTILQFGKFHSDPRYWIRIPAGTTKLHFKLDEITSGNYIGVWNLNDFSVGLNKAKNNWLSVVQPSGNAPLPGQPNHNTSGNPANNLVCPPYNGYNLGGYGCFSPGNFRYQSAPLAQYNDPIKAADPEQGVCQ